MPMTALIVIYLVIALCWAIVWAYAFLLDEPWDKSAARRSAKLSFLAPVWLAVLVWLVSLGVIRVVKKMFRSLTDAA